MKTFGCFVVALTCLTLLPPEAGVKEASTDKSAEIIRKQLETTRIRGKKLEQERRQLEQLIEKGRTNIQKHNENLKTYNYNILEAEKVIEAAQSEIDQIGKRDDERELLFYRCLFSLDQALPLSVSRSPATQLTYKNISGAVENIARDIFTDMQAEAPRLGELQQLIEDRRDYQDRITKRYRPSETQKKESQERLVNEKEEAAEKKQAESLEVARQVETLRAQLEAAEKKIEEIRRLAQQKRQKEEQRLAARSKKTKTSRNAVSPATPAPSPSGGAFASLQGKLSWPAPGTVVRPFGEFTHPQFHVTMNSVGIDVRVRKGASVRAVADGQVIHNSEIPGLGPTVILDHGDNYLTVYGNITANVSKDTSVQNRQVIGIAAGGDDQGGASYHFEIRRGVSPLDPQAWLSGSPKE